MRTRNLAIVLGAIALVVAAIAGPTLAARDTTQAKAKTVKVTMKEFKFVLAPKATKKGVVVFKLKNAGKLPHDFKIAGKKSKLVAPGKTGTLKVVFKKAGRYPYLCTVPGHAAGGMKGVLKVS